MGRGGDRLVAIRAQLGFSQAEFAQRLKVTRETVSRWERGETDPKYDHVADAEKLLTRGAVPMAAEGRASYKVSKKRRRA